MYKISREFSFPMGHRLSKHKGRCQFIHGHNFRVIVGLKSKHLNTHDMVMDFGDLKNIVDEHINEYYDHVLAISQDDMELYDAYRQIFPDARIMAYQKDPTAEVIANQIFVYVKQKVISDVTVDYVTVYENDKSSATYTEIE